MFPADFLWGAAAAAYQVEGAVDEDGRGESIWDRFCTVPGAVWNGDTGAVACDAYHRYQGDIRLLRELGVERIPVLDCLAARPPRRERPRKRSPGLDFYDRYVDDLLGAGIEPVVTLYHWDLPQALEDAGGWPARETAARFAEFAEIVAGRLGDRVNRWITVNEPWIVAWLGYGTGEHAPGRTCKLDALAAAHHVLLAHGLAVDVLRRMVPCAQVGASVDLVAFHPLTDCEADAEAVRRMDGYRNRWILDPVLRGHYPEDTLEWFHPLAPPVEDGDLADDRGGSIDFLGINYYTRNVVRADALGRPIAVENEAERTAMGWEVYPNGLFELLVRLRDEYEPVPIVVTENGAAYADELQGDPVDDPERALYVERHVAAVARAIEHGVPVHGYFLWSLLDNFEWAFGYSKRFGIVYVDFDTLERVPKTSYHRYRDLIAANARARAA